MKKFFIISVVAMVLTACSQDTTNDYSTPEMRVGFDDETRVQLNEECKTVWNRGDMVSVFNKTDANSCWRYRGADLARSGAIALVSSPSTYTVTFADVYGVYPYNANYSINMFGEISLSIPAEQNWKDGSYGVGDNIMVAIGEDENLSFKNIFGWLKLQFTGSDAISKITFRGNNNEPLTGAITYDPYYMEAVFSEGAGKEITLICPEVALEADKVQTFYIAIAPQTFTKGVTVEITTSTGEKITKTTDKKLVIERNAIQPMATLDAVIETPDTPDTPTQPTPPNNEIWYTAETKVPPSKTDVFGATIISNTWNSTTGKGIITFDGEVTSIGKEAFYNRSSLTSIVIPDSVTEIGYEAFRSCSNLTSVTIGNGVTSIGVYAFWFCSNLTTVTIPDSVTSIGGGAFCECKSLANIAIPNSVTEIGSCAFMDCSSLTSITIPEGVTSIEEGTFSSCSKLTSITIPDGVTHIVDYAFMYCSSLTNVNIPDSVTEIGVGAFMYCRSLTSVTIPDSVTSISTYAFKTCSSLKEVYCKPTTPPTECLGAFDENASDRKIYVPASSVRVYKTAVRWSTYADDIVGYDFETGKVVELNNNKIYYTATAKVTPRSSTHVFGANIVSNTYKNGQGVITFDVDVTSIGYEAFSDCTSLISVTIPDSVTSIGASAFNGCTSLTSVTIPDSITSIEGFAFASCTSLTSVTIPDSVTEIGKYAFADCTSLTSVTIPDSVTSIGKYAFYKCTSLTSVTIPNSVTEIGESAFIYCTSLTSITIPNSVTSIGDDAFYECTSLTSVTIGDRVTSIGDHAFYGCTSLTSVTIPDRVTLIGSDAFYGCASLTSVTIPDRVTSIGSYAFCNCTSLTSVTIPDSVISIGGSAFYNCSLTSVTIPDSVTSIGGSAFGRCNSLTAFYGEFASVDNRCLIIDDVLNSFAIGCGATSYTIPDSVTSIGSDAFSGCKSLTSVTIPDGVTSIGGSAFYNCSLTSVTIPDSVTSIGGSAFYNCSSLKEVYCKPTTPPSEGYNMFSYYSNGYNYPIGCKIYVPRASVDAYKAASGWSSYKSSIEPYDF